MCGLFGVARCPHAPDARRVSDAVFLLGVLAEERGVDAAGLALVDPAAPAGRARPAVRSAAHGDVRLHAARVVKRRGPFTQLCTAAIAAAVDEARVVVGHTRWATQGAAGRLANASPLLVGTLIGTHNGDVDIAALRRPPRTARVGDTDTALVLGELAAADGRARRLARVLGGLVGRAALVWVDRNQPGTLLLARAALSPLAVGLDEHGNLFWASNPDWLRTVAAHTGVRFTRGRVLPEGTLLAVDVRGRPRRLWRHEFTPTARERDVRLAPVVAWRGFTAADQAADELGLRHRIRRAALPRPLGAVEPVEVEVEARRAGAA